MRTVTKQGSIGLNDRGSHDVYRDSHRSAGGLHFVNAENEAVPW